MFYSAFHLLKILKRLWIIHILLKQDLGYFRPAHSVCKPLEELSELFEKLIYVCINNFLISKNVLYERQFGFRKSHSTSHAIKYSLKYVADNLEQ